MEWHGAIQTGRLSTLSKASGLELSTGNSLQTAAPPTTVTLPSLSFQESTSTSLDMCAKVTETRAACFVVHVNQDIVSYLETKIARTGVPIGGCG